MKFACCGSKGTMRVSEAGNGTVMDNKKEAEAEGPPSKW